MTVPGTKSLQGRYVLATAALSILGTLATLKTGVLEFESKTTDSAFSRIAHLETMVNDQTLTIGELHSAIARLEVQLAEKPSPLAALFRYIDAMETPAWVKMYYPTEDELRMLYLNRAYEETYDISRERYLDATDHEIYPPRIADTYEQHDREVLDRRDFIEFLEPVRDHRTTPTTDRLTIFWKFYVQLADGRELVAGVQVGPLASN